MYFSKRIEKLDISVSRNAQIIATMRHEMDILSSHRASYKMIETENAELKAKLDLMVSIETVLTASQREVDDILKQNLNARELSVMVGTLRRELNSNELRKSEIRKQLQSVKNDLRAEQEERRQLSDKLSIYESENHALRTKLNRLEKSLEENEIVASSDLDTPEPAKRPRLALQHLGGDINTPSPMSHVSSSVTVELVESIDLICLVFQDEFKNRVAQVRESDSPYLQVKSSSIALTSVLKKPMAMRESHQASKATKSTTDGISKLSIFNKPRIASQGSRRAKNVVYNGIGGTTKVLQSDLKRPSTDSFWQMPSKASSLAIKKKKLSPSALGK